MLSKSFWNGPRFLTALAAGAVAASLALGLAVRLAPDAEQDRPQRVSAASALPSLGPPATPTAAQPRASQLPSPTATATPTKVPTPQPAPKKITAALAPKVPSRAAAKAPAPRAHAPRTAATASGPTGWAALNAAIARIPGYRRGAIQWSVTSRYGHYGTTDLATSHIYIAPSVSTSRLDSVVRHEYAHVVSVRAYGGDWRTAKSAMNAAFGGSGMTGAERAADCMARALGATWTHYTSCTSTSWQALASRLLSGKGV